MKINVFNLGFPFLRRPEKLTKLLHFALGRMSESERRKWIMRINLTTFMMVIALAQLSAKGFGQKISLNESKTPIEKVLQAIRNQSGYGFIYDVKDLQGKKVSVVLKDATVEEAIKASLKDLPLEYKIVKNNIVLTRKEETLLDRMIARFQTIDVTGKVMDQNGQPISGASILVKATGKGVLSDANGDFKLRNIEEGTVLKISSLGYDAYEVSAKAGLGIIRLTPSNNPLEEVRVLAYTKTSQRFAVGNSGGIRAEEIEKHPVQNVMSALQGQVPGIDIRSASGVPGAGMRINIQGINTLSGGTQPLFVIDGIPYISQLSNLGLSGGIVGGTGDATRAGHPLNYLNPQDIESVEVLKDASATAIYGSRAANGAILITTKKGTAGDMKIDASVQGGYGELANKVDLLNTEQYVAMRKEAFKNSNTAMTAGNAYDIMNLYGYDNSRTTDWQEILLGGKAKYLNSKVDFSGGTNSIQYLFGVGYNRQTTVVPGDFADSNGSIHYSIQTNSKNQRFKVQFSGSAMRDVNELQSVDLVAYALKLAPNAPSLFNMDGTINWAPDNVGINTWGVGLISPVSYLNGRKFKNSTVNTMNSAVVSYSFSNGFSGKVNLGYNHLYSDEYELNPATAYDPYYIQFGLSSTSRFSKNTLQSWTVEPQISYNSQWGKLKFSGILGSAFQSNDIIGSRYTALGFLSDALLTDIGSATTLTPDGTVDSKYKYSAIFSQLNLNYNGRYILDLSLRRDGSSTFGPKNRFENFAAIGAAWIFSEEKVIKDKLPILSFGKLRVSYGLTGNDQIDAYSYLDLYSANTPTIAYQGLPSLAVSRQYNPYLQWEKTKKLTLGLDLGFFKDRLLLITSYVRNSSSNSLSPYTLPITTGFSTVIQNFNALIRNEAFEAKLDFKTMARKDFSWNLGINWTRLDNKLVSMENFEKSSFSSTRLLGSPVSGVKILHYLGRNPLTGKSVFSDINGNPTETPTIADRTSFASLTLRDWYGGISNSIRYKQLNLSFFVQLVKSTVNPYFSSDPSFVTNGQLVSNQPVVSLDRWQSPGDQGLMLPYNITGQSTNSNYILSDAYYVDLVFLRFKNVSLSYSLKDNISKKMGLRNIRLFVNAENLGFISTYRQVGLDPETRNGMPPLRTITSGIQVGL